MKTEKGQYGYRDSSRRQRFWITAILAAAIVLQLLARFLTTDAAAKNILTVMAILTVLPMANMASPLIASWKYRTASRSFYEAVKLYEDRCVIVYDLVVTTKDHILPLDAAAIHPSGIYAYCSAPKTQTGKAEKAIQELLKKNKLDMSIRLLLDEHSFLRRLDSLKPVSVQVDDGSMEYAASLLKTLSM